MSNLRFSIIIPTKERHETLFYTLKTCLNQYSFDNYEIIVSDNFSSPSTKEVVDSLNSPKIKYIRSDQPLAMSKNWELGVSQALGEYLIVVGDDDGLLFHALYQLDRLLEVLNLKAIRWNRVYYRWPNSPDKPNNLRIPTEQINHIVSGKKILQKVGNYKLSYDFLPMLYNSAIHRDLVRLLIEKSGRLFSSQTPDIYSGFAFAYLSDKYASLGIPMSINGGSAKSNGLSFKIFGEGNAITEDFKILNEKFGYKWHPEIPNLKFIPAFIAESFQQCKEVLFKSSSSFNVDKQMLLKNCITSMQVCTEEEWVNNLNTIKKALDYDVNLQKWFEVNLFNSPYPHSTKTQENFSGNHSEYPQGFIDGWLHLDASNLETYNVFEAAKLCENLMGYQIMNYQWDNKTKVYKSLLKMGARNMKREFFI